MPRIHPKPKADPSRWPPNTRLHAARLARKLRKVAPETSRRQARDMAVSGIAAVAEKPDGTVLPDGPPLLPEVVEDYSVPPNDDLLTTVNKRNITHDPKHDVADPDSTLARALISLRSAMRADAWLAEIALLSMTDAGGSVPFDADLRDHHLDALGRAIVHRRRIEAWRTRAEVENATTGL